MPCNLTWEPNGVYAKYYGACTVSDLTDAFVRISENPESDTMRSALFDFLNVEDQNVTEQEIEEVSGFHFGLAQSAPNICFASVATDRRLLELWHHYAAVLGMPDKRAVFPTIAEARVWLKKKETESRHFRTVVLRTGA